MLATSPEFNSLDWGSFVTSFAAQGCYVSQQQDYEDPNRIRVKGNFDVKWPCEQNFVSRGGVPAWFEWVSHKGNRFVLLTAVKVRENQH